MWLKFRESPARFVFDPSDRASPPSSNHYPAEPPNPLPVPPRVVDLDLFWGHILANFVHLVHDILLSRLDAASAGECGVTVNGATPPVTRDKLPV